MLIMKIYVLIVGFKIYVQIAKKNICPDCRDENLFPECREENLCPDCKNKNNEILYDECKDEEINNLNQEKPIKFGIVDALFLETKKENVIISDDMSNIMKLFLIY